MAYTAEQWFQKGQLYYDNKRFEEAIESLTKAIVLDPTQAKFYNRRGASKAELKDFHNAINDFDQAILIDSIFAIAYSNRGHAKSNLKDDKSAIADYDQAILIDSNFAGAYSNRGGAKSRLGDYKGAIVDCDKAIIIDQNYAAAYSNRGEAKSRLGDYKGAIIDCDKAISIDPNYAEAYRNRGLVKSKLKNYNAAIVDFDQAILISPKYVEAYHARGLVKSMLENFNAAIVDFDQIILINPKFVEAYGLRGGIHFLLGNLKGAHLDLNCYLCLTNLADFFEGAKIIFEFYLAYPAPYLLHRTLSKFTVNFDQFNTIHPITDTTRQQCRPWKRWEEWRNLSGSEKHESLTHFHALALVNHYMGDCIEAFRIYDEVLDDVKVMKVPLNLMGLYYYIESAKLFRQEYAVILEDAIEQIEETRDELVKNNALRELYYAGQILWANDQVMEAHEFFELADNYLPAAYMQLLTLPMMGADDDDLEAKIADIREREAELLPSDAFLQGFLMRPFRLEKPGEDFLSPILYYAHYREIAQAIAEVRDPVEPFEHHELWDAFYWKPEDEKELDWLLRRERLAKINKALLEKFKANLQSGSGVHSLEHLETAFAQKLKHDLWEGTQYLGFEDFKSKSEDWPNAAREVATFIRDSRRLDANSKLLLVEYCHLRGSLSIEDVYLLYFYISYVNTSQDSGIAGEANSAAVKKVVELTLSPVSFTGKVLTAAAGGAVARLFKLFLSGSEMKDQINMEEFQNPENKLERVHDFEVFTENFLRFIGYQREMLGAEAFEKQYPLEGFEDRSRKTGVR